jgi:dUTP pyrophosphatase
MPMTCTPGSAGIDIATSVDVTLHPHSITKLKTGLRVEIPDGHFGMLMSKSSWASRGVITLLGVVDSDYRGDVTLMLHNVTRQLVNLACGTFVSQLVVMPYTRCTLQLTQQLSSTSRGTKGFGEATAEAL